MQLLATLLPDVGKISQRRHLQAIDRACNMDQGKELDHPVLMIMPAPLSLINISVLYAVRHPGSQLCPVYKVD